MRKWRIPACGAGSPARPEPTPREWFEQRLLVLYGDCGPEVLQLGNRLAPHVQTMEEVREAAARLLQWLVRPVRGYSTIAGLGRTPTVNYA